MISSVLACGGGGASSTAIRKILPRLNCPLRTRCTLRLHSRLLFKQEATPSTTMSAMRNFAEGMGTRQAHAGCAATAASIATTKVARFMSFLPFLRHPVLETGLGFLAASQRQPSPGSSPGRRVGVGRSWTAPLRHPPAAYCARAAAAYPPHTPPRSNPARRSPGPRPRGGSRSPAAGSRRRR